MEDHIQRPEVRQRIGHIVVDQLEASGLGQVCDVLPPPSTEIVDAYDCGAGVEQQVTQMGSDEAGTTQHDRAIKSPCCPAHVWTVSVSEGVRSMRGLRPGV
jgi:hypothetical protein